MAARKKAKKKTRAESRRERIVAFVKSLPDADAVGAQHLSLTVRKKRFGYFLDDHHGDGIVGIAMKAAPGVQQDLVELAPDRYCVPAYIGKSGWVTLRVDRPKIDWAEVEDLIVNAYRLQAPKKLVAELDEELEGHLA